MKKRIFISSIVRVVRVVLSSTFIAVYRGDEELRAFHVSELRWLRLIDGGIDSF